MSTDVDETPSYSPLEFAMESSEIYVSVRFTLAKELGNSVFQSWHL